MTTGFFGLLKAVRCCKSASWWTFCCRTLLLLPFVFFFFPMVSHLPLRLSSVFLLLGSAAALLAIVNVLLSWQLPGTLQTEAPQHKVCLLFVDS